MSKGFLEERKKEVNEMSSRKISLRRTQSGTEIQSQLDADIVPVTHTVFYRKSGDSLVPVPLQLEAEGYESDSDLLDMIDQIEEEFEQAKNNLNELLCRADDDTHSYVDEQSIGNDKDSSAIKAASARPVCSPTSVVCLDVDQKDLERTEDHNTDNDDDISGLNAELTQKRKNETNENHHSKRLRFSSPPRVSTNKDSSPLSSSNRHFIISPESQTTRSLELLSLIQFPSDSKPLNRELQHYYSDDDSSSKDSAMSPTLAPTSMEGSLLLEVKAHNLPQMTKKRVLRNYLRKRKPSVYFELYSSVCDTPITDSQKGDDFSSEWYLMYRSCTILKDSNPCWKVSDIKLNWPHHLSKDVKVKISLFELNKRGANHFIGSTVTTMGYIITGFTVSQVFLSKKGKAAGSLSVQAGVQ